MEKSDPDGSTLNGNQQGDRYVVVPPNALKVTFDSAAKEWKGTSSLTREQLRAMPPEFKYEGKFDN